MASRIILLVTIAALAAGCGRIAESRFNPLNWFGRAESRAASGALVPASFGQVTNQPLIAQATALNIERTSTGAIIHAEGITPALGYWDAELVRVPSEAEGELRYIFRMLPPPEIRITGTVEQRKVNVGRTLSNAELAQVQRIVVQSASNTLTVRR